MTDTIFCFPKETAVFFKNELREDFTFADYQEFVSYWFFVIMLSDGLTIVGSVYKMVIDQKVSSRRGMIDRYFLNTKWIYCQEHRWWENRKHHKWVNVPPNSWSDMVRINVSWLLRRIGQNQCDETNNSD